MTVIICNAMVSGDVHIIRYNDQDVSRIYSLDVFVESDVLVCEPGLLEDHCIIYDKENNRFEGRFIVVYYAYDEDARTHQHTLRSTTECNVPGDFEFRRHITEYTRFGEGF